MDLAVVPKFSACYPNRSSVVRGKKCFAEGGAGLDGLLMFAIRIDILRVSEFGLEACDESDDDASAGTAPQMQCHVLFRKHVKSRNTHFVRDACLLH